MHSKKINLPIEYFEHNQENDFDIKVYNEENEKLELKKNISKLIWKRQDAREIINLVSQSADFLKLGFLIGMTSHK